MASGNPDDKDGTKNSGEKKYSHRGVQKKTASTYTARCGSGENRHIGTFDTAADAARAYDVRARELYVGSKKTHKLYKGVYEKKGQGKWYAQCSHGGKNAYIGTYDTELEAALAYDKRCRELNRAEETLNFPNILTENDPSLAATESTLPIANPSASGVQVTVPSGSSSASIGKGEKRKQITISKSLFDAFLPYHEARKREFAQLRQNVAQLRTTSTLPIATSSVSGVAIGSESANISSEQPAVMESFGNPGDLKDVPSEELLTDADKAFVESLLNQGKASDEDKPS